MNSRSALKDLSSTVSIIIPCYNASATVAEAIDSALAQTHPNVEVVVVLDGPTDKSRDIVEPYADRITLVDQANKGLSAARNAGIEASRGEYLLLLDADDVLLPNCAANRVEVLDKWEAVGLVAGWYREIDEQGAVSERIPELRTVWKGNAFRQAVRRNWGPPVGWCFRRDAYDRVGGFDPLLKSCEDWDFVIRLSSRYEVAYDPTVQVYYRKSSNQMSANHPRMLDAASRVNAKSRAYATNRWQHWIDSQFGKFELGRRTLFAILFQQPSGKLATLTGLIPKFPYLLWVGPASAVSFLFGKRAGGKT